MIFIALKIIEDQLRAYSRILQIEEHNAKLLQNYGFLFSYSFQNSKPHGEMPSPPI